MDLAGLRADRARRPALRSRHRRRQGRRHDARRRGGVLPQVDGRAARQRPLRDRGRGGDRLREPRQVPRRVQEQAVGGLHRALRHRELRHRCPRAHLPAARHLHDRRHGAGARAPGPQRHVGRPRARPGAGDVPPDRGPPGQEGRDRRARALQAGPEDAREAARADPEAPLQRGQVQARGRADEGHEALRREGLLGLRAALDAAVADRDRVRRAADQGLLEPDHRPGRRPASRCARCRT